MCLGELGRVVDLIDERTAVIECARSDGTVRQVSGALDVMLADGVEVRTGDVVIVSMGFVLAITDELELASVVDASDRTEART